MEYRNLEITVNSAKDLKNVNFFSKMDAYVVAMIDEDSRSAQLTPVSKESGRNPNWNYKLKFAIDEAAARANRLRLVFHIRSKRSLGDRDVGIVVVPVKDLFDGDNKSECLVSYAVRTKKGSKGTLNFSYKIGEKIDLKTAAAYGGLSGGDGKKYGDEPVMAYPVIAGASSYAYPPQQATAAGYMYPPPQQQQGHGYPQYAPAGYGGGGYKQQQQQYGTGKYGGGCGKYKQQQQYGTGGYGGGCGKYGGGCGGYMAPPRRKPNRMGGMGMGLGAGLLGGLLVGDMISDAGDMGGGFDGGGFDF